MRETHDMNRHVERGVTRRTRRKVSERTQSTRRRRRRRETRWNTVGGRDRGVSSADEAIYEREYVKRGGRGFSRKAAPWGGPGRRSRRGPSSSSEPGRGAKAPSFPCVRCKADATCSLNHLFGIVGHADVAISQVSKGRLHSIARRSSRKAAVRLRCGVVPRSSRPPAVARRVAPSRSVQVLLKGDGLRFGGRGQAADLAAADWYGFESRSMA